ncbi:MAG: thiamine pyrophosphate-binding protein [Gemmatimonadota bacterium]
MTVSSGQSLTAALETLGVRCVFGLPGTQNVALFEALRGSSIRTVLATSELAASFMAVGYARASGNPAVLVTIPGPGFTYALPGLAEARLDSVPLLHLVVHQPLTPERRFRHQEIPQLEMVRPLVKEVLEVGAVGELPNLLSHAFRQTLAGEPGPVLVWIAAQALDGMNGAPGAAAPPEPHVAESSPVQRRAIEDLVRRFSGARRPILFLGLGSVGVSGQVGQLVDRVITPFFTTPSGRGVLPEDHSLCLSFDFDRGGLESLNELLDSSDLILALGCKLSHNGTGGFKLRLGEKKLVQVNTDSAALGANYSASALLQDRVEMVVPALLEALGTGGAASEWTLGEIAEWRARIASADPGYPHEPAARGMPSGTVKEVIEVLREELPRDAIVVTDSGLHQVLVRRHFPVMAPRGLIMPTDFQSMGFGLPAAIGASLAAPERQVVAVIGDGGLAMSGMELLTLAREMIPVTVFVFNDGYLNLIRLQQERDYGHSHCVRLHNPDMEVLSEAMGVGFFRLDEDVRARIRDALSLGGPALVEVPLGDSPGMRSVRRKAATKAAVRSILGEGRVGHLKGVLDRLRG